jgi:hypothetical protein
VGLKSSCRTVIRGRIDPAEGAVLVRHDPNAVATSCDPSFWACWWYWKRGTDCVLHGIDPNERSFVARVG